MTPEELRRKLEEHGIDIDTARAIRDDVTEKTNELSRWLGSEVFPSYMQTLTAQGRGQEIPEALAKAAVAMQALDLLATVTEMAEDAARELLDDAAGDV